MASNNELILFMINEINSINSLTTDLQRSCYIAATFKLYKYLVVGIIVIESG